MHKLQKSRVWKLLYQAGWEGQGRLGVFFIWADANSVSATLRTATLRIATLRIDGFLSWACTAEPPWADKELAVGWQGAADGCLLY